MLQRHALLTIPILLSVLAAGSAQAQTSARHQVNVSIPSVLRLSLPSTGDASPSQVDVGVRVDVDGASTTVTPGSTRLAILANTSWTLNAHVEAVQTGLGLAYSLDGGSFLQLHASDHAVTSGVATGGWRNLELAYRANASGLADGGYDVTVVYTLTQP